jgi:glutathione reductase (NADPH)
MKAKEYDLVVIGTGDAGTAVAAAAARERWKAAIIEKKAVGGTCALWGCVPKKILISGGELADFNRRLATERFLTAATAISWPELMAFKNRITSSFSPDAEKHLRKQGIDIYKGAARFTGETSIAVDGVHLQGKYVHIASGARSRPMAVPGAEYLTTSDEFLYCEHLPERIVFVGGGYISFEFAHLAARCGRDVTIIMRSAQALKKFDPDMVSLLLTASRERGISVSFNQPLARIEKKGGELLVIVHDGSKEKTYRADLAVHGAGRVPDIDDLNLQAAGIEASRDGVSVNEYLQSVSNPRVYAAGDAAAGGPPLTPVAMLEGSVAADNLVYGRKRMRPDYRFVPSVVFTLPKLAAVGLLEEDARKRAAPCEVVSKDTSGWLHNKRVNETVCGFKVILDKSSRKILGVHILDGHADDLINMFALAMQNNLTADDIKKVLYAYPSASSSIQYMLGQ